MSFKSSLDEKKTQEPREPNNEFLHSKKTTSLAEMFNEKKEHSSYSENFNTETKRTSELRSTLTFQLRSKINCSQPRF